MGSSSGAAPEIFEGFQQPTNPETLTPNFGQVSGTSSGQPGGFEFPAPNGFSEFFMPDMPTMMSSPYIAPGNQVQPGVSQPQASSPAASSPAATPDMVSMFDGAPAPSMAAQPPSMGSAMFDTQPVPGGPGIGPGGQVSPGNPFQTQAAIRAGAGAQLAGLPFAGA